MANERDLVSGTLNHLLSLGADEVIAVDGSSQDGTDEIIRREFPSVRLFQTACADRALQMNTGAFEAQGDIFLFVHVDMRLPSGAIHEVRNQIRLGFVGGGFIKRYEPANFLLKLYAFCLNRFYFSWMRCLAGTNAIFVRREAFESLHGFPEVPLLEDLIFSDCMKKRGKIAIIRKSVVVSSRRYLKRGIIRQILQNGRVFVGYKLFHERLEDLKERYVSHRYGT
ncbi:MAG: hypothetical protein A3G87_06285 [Omnitrophica bacterium RIFCSPLOWO2_12_FULL_50_11]|nr:MAG: hypothetical protein A3G87_06285 [Omnitrophica bacterium RIFCSPLOWO2_12_FULL_50_11]